MSEVLRQAAQTRALGGRPVRTFDTRWLAGLIALELVGGASSGSLFGVAPFVAVAGTVALLVAQLVALTALWSRGVRANNDGVEALALDRFDDAEAGFRVLVLRRHPRWYTALGLQNLATVAIQRGELADATRLARAAMELLSRSRTPRTVEAFSGHIRANYAFALLASGELDEAEAVLRAPPEAGSLAKSEALFVRSRALLLLRRERWEDTARLLQSERTLLRNTLTGDEAVLAEAMEAWALHQCRGVVDGQPRTMPLLEVDDDERAFVCRLVPGCEAVLTGPT